VVEVTKKPVDFFSRVDNRGTAARGPLEFLTSSTFNNFLGGHEALTLTAAGAFRTRELQFYAANCRQVLTGEGLTYFATASYGFGHPGTEELELLNYRTRSFYAETGLSYPVIRARERNFNVSAGPLSASCPRAMQFARRDQCSRLARSAATRTSHGDWFRLLALRPSTSAIALSTSSRGYPRGKHDQTPRLTWIQATRAGGVHARLRRVAGCATPSGSAGHAGETGQP
jgi:hemolysin activation/secretion protein